MGHQVGVLALLKVRGSVGGIRYYLELKFKANLKAPFVYLMGYPVFRSRAPKEHIEYVVNVFRPDIVIIQAGSPLSSSSHFVQLGVPTGVYLRDVQFDNYGGNPLEQQQILYFANSRFTSSCFKARFGLEAIVIPPIVLPERYKVYSQRKVVLFVNPVPEKGVDLAIRIAEQATEIPFVFLEGWPQVPHSLQTLKRRLRTLKNVHWQSRVQNMRRVYRHAKILLVPSRWQEAWGRVVTEAQISGIPVLASNRGGLTESVGLGGKVLDFKEDASVWVNELRRMWNNHDYYDGMVEASYTHAARKNIEPNYLAQNLVEQLSKHIAASVST